ncbi:MAG: TonB family protein, partial [Arenimonas sp.]
SASRRWTGSTTSLSSACQSALLQGQGAADAGDFDKAGAAALEAHGVCNAESDPILTALEGRIQSGKAMAQTCGAASAQARELLHAGHPKAALEALAPVHADCANWPGFPELEALPANAQAQAMELVHRAGPLLQAGAAADAQALVQQALAMDADADGLAELRVNLAKRLGTEAPPAAPLPAPTAPTAPPVASTPVPTPASAAPGTVATAAAIAAADKTAKDRAAKLALEKERKLAEQRAKAAAAAAASRPAPAAPVAAAPVPAPVPAAPVPASAGRGNALVATSTPQPPYPPQALRAKTVGVVIVAFVVNTDGSVGSVRIVSAKPRGVFERGVTSTVGRWRFQPVDQPQPTTRTITFQP